MRLIISLALICFATGCIRIEHPLSESAEVVTDEGLVGKWALQDPVFPDSRDAFKIAAAEGGGLELINFCDLDKPVAGKLLEFDGTFFLEVESEVPYVRTSPANGETKEKAHATERVAIPFLFERRGDWFALSCLNLKAVRAYVENGAELKGTIKEEGLFTEITITSPASDFGKCLAKHQDELFVERQVYRRLAAHKPLPRR